MNLTEEQLKQIIKEEFNNLINEEEIDEKLFSALKNFGKDLFKKAKRSFSGMPDPGKSGGVGSWYTRYKEPQKEPQKEPEEEPSTALTVPGSTLLSTDVVDISPESEPAKVGKATARVEPRLSLPSGEKPSETQFEPFGALPAPLEIKKQLLLSEPKKIGIVDKVGDLLTDTTGEAFNLLFQEKTRAFKSSDFFKSLAAQQQNQADTHINTILKHLISTERILKNPTFTVVSEQIDEETVPSARQIERNVEFFDSYIIKSLIHSIKQKYNYIPPTIIDFIINSLHEEGRLAISKRMYNSLKHTQDPRLNALKAPTHESKSYSSFYNNWKKYTGVKI